MAQHREQPQGEVLQHHRTGPRHAETGNARLGGSLQRDRARAARVARRALMALRHRLLAGVHELLRRRGDADLELELDDYLRPAIEQKVAAAMSPEEAERSARLEMGGFEQIKERVREIRWESAVDRLSQDVRHAVRSLAASK